MKFLWVLFLPALVWANTTVLPRWTLPAERGHLYEMGTHEATRPIVVGELLFYGTRAGYVYCLNRLKGYVVWKRQLPGGVEGALGYGRSKIFVGDVKGNLWAFRAHDGSVAWKKKIASEWLTPPVLIRNRLYITSSRGHLYALTTRRGEEKWLYTRSGDEKMTVRGVGGPTAYGSEVFQGFSDGSVLAFNAKSGEVIWNKKLGTRKRFYDADLAPYVDNDSVIVSSYDGSIYNLDRLNGKTKWVLRIGAYGGVLAKGDQIYFSGLNRNFYSINKNTSQITWKRPFEKGIGFAPTMVGDRYLVFTTSSDPVYVLDPKDGTFLWSGALGAGTFAPPAGHAGGWFYCLSNFGHLFAFELASQFARKWGPQTLPTPSGLKRDLVYRSRHRRPS